MRRLFPSQTYQLNKLHKICSRLVMTLTKITDKINQTYKIGTLVIDRYNGKGIVSGYKYCKNYGGELPIVRFTNKVEKFASPECLSIYRNFREEEELEEEIFEPPDPDDYLGQSLPLANLMLEGIRRLDYECQKLRAEINFLNPYLLNLDPAETLFGSHLTASRQVAKLCLLFCKKHASAQQKALTLKLTLDFSVIPWLIEPMDGWYTSCYLETQENLTRARDDWLHQDLT